MCVVNWILSECGLFVWWVSKSKSIYFNIFLQCGDSYISDLVWFSLKIHFVHLNGWVSVVYSDWCLECAAPKSWSKYVFSTFFVLKGKKRNKSAAKSWKKMFFLSFHQNAGRVLSSVQKNFILKLLNTNIHFIKIGD